MIDILKPAKLVWRLFLHRKHWRYHSIGFCSSCGSLTSFIRDCDLDEWLKDHIQDWSWSSQLKTQIFKRENYRCIFCFANYRQRTHAACTLGLSGFKSSRSLILKLKTDPQFTVLETAAYNIFRDEKLQAMPNYMVTEYFDDQPFGTMVNGIRNENLEQLTFPDNSFDVIINSDVLEHVADIEKALSEIKRVLKPGGLHIFTIPVDHQLQRTTERAKLIDGKTVHLLPPEIHGDTIRDAGILAFRDFGVDVLNYLTRPGFPCLEKKYFSNGEFITSVYYQQKMVKTLERFLASTLQRFTHSTPPSSFKPL